MLIIIMVLNAYGDVWSREQALMISTWSRYCMFVFDNTFINVIVILYITEYWYIPRIMHTVELFVFFFM